MRRGNFRRGSRVAVTPMEHVARAAWAVVLGWLASGGTWSVQCECADRAIFVHVPVDRAAFVTGVTPSGVACASAKAMCASESAMGCTKYRIGLQASGACHIDVDFSIGPP